MKKRLAIVLALSMVVAFIGSAAAQAGMMGAGIGGDQTPMGQPPTTEEDRPGEQPSRMPMASESAVRMMNACIGAMEGMARMGQMMGGMRGSQGGTSQIPSGQKR